MASQKKTAECDPLQALLQDWERSEILLGAPITPTDWPPQFCDFQEAKDPDAAYTKAVAQWLKSKNSFSMDSDPSYMGYRIKLAQAIAAMKGGKTVPPDDDLTLNVQR